MTPKELKNIEKGIFHLNTKLLLLLVFLVAYLLMLLSKVLIPLVLAVFIGVLIEKPILWLKRLQVPIWISFFLIIILIAGFFSLFVSIITETINEILSQRKHFSGILESKLTGIFDFIKLYLGDRFHLQNFFSGDLSFINGSWLVRASAYIFSFVSGVGESILMCAIFLMFLIKPILNFESYFNFLSKNSKQSNRIITHYKIIKTAVFTYMKVKLIASFANAVVIFMLCSVFEIDFALFWFMMTFLCYFIPNIGPFAVSSLITLLAFIQIDSYSGFALLLVLLFLFQFIVDNIIEPRLMGQVLSLSPVTVLLGLIIWAYLWGIIGMFLAVPLLVFLRQILILFPRYSFLIKLMEGMPKNKKS